MAIQNDLAEFKQRLKSHQKNAQHWVEDYELRCKQNIFLGESNLSERVNYKVNVSNLSIWNYIIKEIDKILDKHSHENKNK